MKKILSVALSLLALTLLASCGADASASAAGKYTLDKTGLEAAMKAMMPEGMPTEGPAAEAGAKMLKEAVDAMNGTIELKADNTCVMLMTGSGPDQKATGTWKLEGDKISITSKEEGKEEEETKVGTFADGVITVEEEKGGKKMTMKFIKAAK
tara:strand:- start:7724 stop:8182 length:459 start_codon:yes stop_codon:yes gene_type:complete